MREPGEEFLRVNDGKWFLQMMEVIRHDLVWKAVKAAMSLSGRTCGCRCGNFVGDGEVMLIMHNGLEDRVSVTWWFRMTSPWEQRRLL